MDNIPTAEEFLKDRADYNPVTGFYGLVEEGDLIMFTKLHVKAALEAAGEKAKQGLYSDGVLIDEVNGVLVDREGYQATCYINKDSILNSYPESNIK